MRKQLILLSSLPHLQSLGVAAWKFFPVYHSIRQTLDASPPPPHTHTHSLSLSLSLSLSNFICFQSSLKGKPLCLSSLLLDLVRTRTTRSVQGSEEGMFQKLKKKKKKERKKIILHLNCYAVLFCVSNFVFNLGKYLAWSVWKPGVTRVASSRCCSDIFHTPPPPHPPPPPPPPLLSLAALPVPFLLCVTV